jgi:hypothetical protein
LTDAAVVVERFVRSASSASSSIMWRSGEGICRLTDREVVVVVVEMMFYYRDGDERRRCWEDSMLLVYVVVVLTWCTAAGIGFDTIQ